MNEANIADTLLRTAERAAAVDLGQVGHQVRDYLRNLDGTAVAGRFVNAVNMHSRERVERRVQATLDIAYLLGNLDGWHSENREKCFEKIAAFLGRRPADVSPDAVGLNAKLAHLRDRVSEDELLTEFIDGVRRGCESFDGMPVPGRRAFALWIALGVADGEMSASYRKALQLLRGEFKHSALLYGALGGLPLYPVASAAGGTGMGLFCAIMGGMKALRRKQNMDRYSPLIGDEFLRQAETLIRRIDTQESVLAETTDPAEKERVRTEYAAASRELQELIDPSSSDDGDEEAQEDE